MPYICLIHIYFDSKRVVSLIFCLLITYSLYKLVSKIHWRISIPLKKCSIHILSLIMISPPTLSSCLVENKFFRRSGACNTLLIYFI
jgi:hypothetical protein